MTRRFLTPIFAVVLAFTWACSGSRSEPHKIAAEEKKPPPVTAKSSGCTRGEPEPLLSSQSEFKRTSSLEAYETVKSSSPIQLTIRHFGCAHYALDFEFQFPGKQMPQPQVSLTDAAGLLEKLSVKQENRRAITSIVEATRKMASEPYKQPLIMSETETLTATTPALNVLLLRYDVAI